MVLAQCLIGYVAMYSIAILVMHKAKPTVVHRAQRFSLGQARCRLSIALGQTIGKRARKNTPHPLKILGKTAACQGGVGPETRFSYPHIYWGWQSLAQVFKLAITLRALNVPKHPFR